MASSERPSIARRRSTPSDAAPAHDSIDGLTPASICRVVNEGDDFYEARSAGQWYGIDAGSETLVPFEAVCLWLGNPSLRDFDARRMDRTAELHRLRVRYGTYEHHDLWDDAKPKLAAYTLDGTRIPTVVEDPDGLGARVTMTDPSAAGDTNQFDALQREVADLKMQVARNALTDNIDPDDLDDENWPDGAGGGTSDDDGDDGPPEDDDKATRASSTPSTPPVDKPTKVRVSGSATNPSKK